jgi:short-subunit dehydrogenase
MNIEGSRIIITGASSGIGAALALALAERGAKLVLAARRMEGLRRVQIEIGAAASCESLPNLVPCDITVPSDMRRLVATAMERLGGIDILINNAGVSVYGNLARTSAHDIDSLFRVNFFGALDGMHRVLPIMQRQGSGLIVNIASVAALHGVPYLGGYSASKAALAALSESLRAELKTSGIGVMVVYPSYTQTNLFEVEKNVGGARRPKGHYATPASVAEAIVKAMEMGKQDLVLSKEGKLLAFARSTVPQLVNRAMELIATRLRLTEGGGHA